MPIKIGNLNNVENAAGLPKNADHVAGSASRALVFQRTLTGLGAEAQDARLTALVADIDKQGQKLSRRADVRELERYRALIRQFMDEIVSNSYAFFKENAFGGRGSHKLMATVNTVNQRLDELAREVLKNEADNIQVLNLVDDIRGLLMDLFL